MNIKRDIEEDCFNSHNSNSNDSCSRKRKKKSRFSDESEKVFIPGLPTIIPSNLSKQQEEIYILQLQIESITRRLHLPGYGISEVTEERSPSPEPVYNTEGKRLNTREYRTKRKLEDERHALILKMFALNPQYKPPGDYKPPLTKISEKVVIPQEEYPDINFVGLIIGPRGNTLKGMERDTGAKIIIRGKGSVKEGKLARKDGQPLPGEDEPLHAFVTGPTQEAVANAVAKINDVIHKGIELPENLNDLRRSQLRELALLNGTLRENEGPRCSNCGANNHRSWQCPDKPNITNNVFCTNCNGVGHLAKDCKEKRMENSVNKAKIDEEYLSLMAELGEAPAPSAVPPPPPPVPAPRTATSTLGGPTPSSNNAASSSHDNSWSNGNGGDSNSNTGAAAAGANGTAAAAAWSGYYSGYEGYNSAAYAHMWADPTTAAAWAAASGQTDATGAVSGTAVTGTAADYTQYDWSQYAQWYAQAQAQVQAQTQAAGTSVPPPPPPQSSSATHPMYHPPPPPPPPPPQ